MRMLRRLLINLRLRLIRLIFYPYFAYVDFRNGQVLKREGDVVSEKTISKVPGGVFCVFHLFPKQRVPASTMRALTTLKGLGVQLVIVSNGPVPADDVPAIEALAHTIIVRKNVGRDFGGYRAGLLHVLERYTPDRLLVVNDSVFFRENGLEAFFRSLCEGGDYIGAAENHEFGYHLGSYALAFGRKVFESPHFLKFWKNYQLSELRPKVIRTGEIGLNRMVIGKIGARPQVVFSPQRLGDALGRIPLTELIETATRMPGSFPDRDTLKDLQETAEQWFEGATPEDDAKPATTKRVARKLRPVDAAAALAGSTPEAVLQLVSKGYREGLERSLIDFVFRGSQIHWGALPFARHLDCPIIKADLVLRGIYGVGELSAFRDCMSESEYEEFFAMATRRGVPEQHWTMAQRAMLAVGYI